MDSTGRFLYVTNNGSANVSGYTVNPGTGALTAVRGSPFAAGTGPEAIAIDPTGRFVFVANHVGNSVSAYTIDPGTGALAVVGGSPFAAGSSPLGVAIATVTGP